MFRISSAAQRLKRLPALRRKFPQDIALDIRSQVEDWDDWMERDKRFTEFILASPVKSLPLYPDKDSKLSWYDPIPIGDHKMRLVAELHSLECFDHVGHHLSEDVNWK